MNSPARRIRVRDLQRRMACVWLTVCALAVIELLALDQRLDSARGEAWGWCTQTFAPTFGVIVTGLIAAESDQSSRSVTRFFAAFAVIFVTSYGLFALSTPFLSTEPPLIELFRRSGTVLGIFQGGLAAVITFAFSGQKKSEDRTGHQA